MILLYIIAGIAILPQLLNIQKNALDNRCHYFLIFSRPLWLRILMKNYPCIIVSERHASFFSANTRYCLDWKMLTPRTNILKGLLRHIYIEKGQIKCFIFSFFGLGLKVTYNLDFFEKFRPPPSVFKSPNLNFRLICFFFNPPTPISDKVRNFPVF